MDFIYRSNYDEYIEKAKRLYKTYGEKIVLPSDLAWVEEEIDMKKSFPKYRGNLCCRHRA